MCIRRTLIVGQYAGIRKVVEETCLVLTNGIEKVFRDQTKKKAAHISNLEMLYVVGTNLIKKMNN